MNIGATSQTTQKRQGLKINKTLPFNYLNNFYFIADLIR